MKMSLFTHPHVILNMYEFLSYVRYIKEDIVKNADNQTALGPLWLP